MDYKIDFSTENGFVRIKVHNSITADLERSFAKEAIETASKNGVLNYYADVRGVKNVTSIIDQYTLAYEEMASFRLDRKSKIAIVHSLDDHSHDFIEVVFRNAGYSCKLFVSEDEAYDWLKA